MESQQVLFLVILAGALALFVSDKLRVDVTAVLVLVALTASGILSGTQALSGFASEPAIIVGSVFVLSGGLTATGLTDRIGAAVGRAAGGSEWRAIAVIMPAVALLAAFTHHLMVTAMMLPIVMKIAREKQLPASRLLMPMSLAASLGTTLTLISAPAFLLADNLLRHAGSDGLHIFSITPIGIALVLLGMLFMLLGRWLLPRRNGSVGEADYLKLERYYTELVVEKESPWIGKPLADLEKAFGERLQVVDWLRQGERRPRTIRHAVMQARDVLLVRASPDEIASIKTSPGLALHAVAKYGEAQTGERDVAMLGEEQLVQALVAPGSEFVGRTIGTIDFLHTFGVVVVGLWRKEGWIGAELAQVELIEGDMLVLWGRQQKFSELAAHRGFLMMVPFIGNQQQRHRWPLALGIMLGAIVLAATEILPAQIAFLAGALAMVLSRCIGIEQAYRAIDVRIYVMIAGVIPLGLAMEKTGTAKLLADVLLHYTSGWTPFAVLLVMFTAAALLTQVLSDAATTVLLGPVALVLARALGLPPEPFVVCTAIGAVAAFLTPIGHHGNLLILTPGQYRFGDFLRVGGLLTVLIGLTSAWLASWLWLNGPLLPAFLGR